jgi:hypothetical protein
VKLFLTVSEPLNHSPIPDRIRLTPDRHAKYGSVFPCSVTADFHSSSGIAADHMDIRVKVWGALRRSQDAHSYDCEKPSERIPNKIDPIGSPSRIRSSYATSPEEDYRMSTKMKSDAAQADSTPFFARYLEGQHENRDKLNQNGAAAPKDEGRQTLKYPSDRDEEWLD